MNLTPKDFERNPDSELVVGTILLYKFKEQYGTTTDSEDVFLSLTFNNEFLVFKKPEDDMITRYFTYLKFIQLFIRPRTRLKLSRLTDRYTIVKTKTQVENLKPGILQFKPPPPDEEYYIVINTKEEWKDVIPEHEPLEAVTCLFTDFNPYVKNPQNYFWHYIFPIYKFESSQYIEILLMTSENLRLNIQDRWSLKTYLQNDPFGNYINMRDPIHIESQEFARYMSYLTDGDDPEYKDVAIDLINRVLAVSIQESVKFAVKTCTERNGVVIRFYSQDQVKTLFQQFNFNRTEEYESKGEHRGDRLEKRRRIEGNWFRYWLRHAKRGQINDVIFLPWSLNNPHDYETQQLTSSEDVTKTRVINEFHGWPVTKEYCKECYMNSEYGKGVTFFKDMILNKICNGDEECSEYLLNWIAFLVQKPAEKSKVAIVVRGQEGLGKSWILSIFHAWYRNHYYYLGGGDPSTKFNGFMQHRKIIGIDEVHKLIENLDAMKALITETTFSVEKKGVDQRNEINLAEFFGTTNNNLRLPLTRDSRRWVIIEANEMNVAQLGLWKKEMEKQYNSFFDSGYGQPKAKGPVWALLYFFLERDIKNFIPFLQIPLTSAVIRNIEMSLHPVHAWWKYVLTVRQLKSEMEPNTPLQSYNYSTVNLFEAFRSSQQWQDLTGNSIKKVRMTEDQFMAELEKVVDYVLTTTRLIKFKSWKIQEEKWLEFYPNLQIRHNFVDVRELSTFEKDASLMMARTPINAMLGTYTQNEINFIVYSLEQKIKSLDPTVKISYHSSLSEAKRPSLDTNKNVIEFTYLYSGFKFLPSLLNQFAAFSRCLLSAGSERVTAIGFRAGGPILR